MSSRDLSLDAPFDEGQELTHLDLLREEAPNQEEALAQQEAKKIREREVLNAMKHLNEKEAYVIKNRIMADAPLTLQEIGDYLKLSRERVRQIEATLEEKKSSASRQMSSRRFGVPVTINAAMREIFEIFLR
jgi:RNA polymerase sigma-32 factor